MMKNNRVSTTIGGLLCFYIATVQIDLVSSFSCSGTCDKGNCEDGFQPICCFSGKTNKDGCNCCDQCVKKTGEKCGGLWMTDGKCGPEEACVLFEKRNALKSEQNQKDWMQNNEGNGTCYTKSAFAALPSKYKPKDWVILEKTGGSETGNTGTIQNCDNILRSVQSNFPIENVIPEGYKALKIGLNETWQNSGGLAKCVVDTECPKAEYDQTDHTKARLKALASGTGQGSLGNGACRMNHVGQFSVICICLAISFLKYLN